MNDNPETIELLPTPLSLLHDTGVIGQMLKQMPRDVLDEAQKKKDPWSWLARWVKKNPVEHMSIGTVENAQAKCKKLLEEGFEQTGMDVYSASTKTRLKSGIREIRFYRHKSDKRKIVRHDFLDAKWPSGFHKTFAAAASQWNAVQRLVEIGRGGGSISRNWRDEMRKARLQGDQKTENHWSDKIAASLLKIERGRRWLFEGEKTQLNVRREAQRRFERFYAADVRKLGRKKADAKWRGNTNENPHELPFKLITISDKLAAVMTLNWLSAPNGWPGHCFFSDRALAEYLGLSLTLLLPPRALLKNPDAWKLIRTTRERIGLKKGEIIFRGVKHVENGEWALIDCKGKESDRFPGPPNAVPPNP